MPGTWRTFQTLHSAQVYEMGCWLRLLRRRAAQGDGTLLNVATRLRENFAGSWPDDSTTIASILSSMSANELASLRSRLDQLPILGRRNGALVADAGHSVCWAEPRLTLDGLWAVPCPDFDRGGVPEPLWPEVDYGY